MLINIEYLGTDGQVYIATAEVYESSEASIPADGAHAADTLINVLFDDLEPQDKLSLLWMGMGMAAVRKNDSQNNHDGVA